MKKLSISCLVKFLILLAFGYFGVRKETTESLLCLGVVVLITVAEIYCDTKKFKRW